MFIKWLEIISRLSNKKSIWTSFENKGLVGIIIRPALISDADFILNEIVSVSVHGQFHPAYTFQEHQRGLFHQIVDVIVTGFFPAENGNKKGSMLICDFRDELAGFCWMTLSKEGVSEIYMMGCTDRFRRNGIGTELLRRGCGEFPGKVKYHVARVYKNKEEDGMTPILLKEGFKRLGVQTAKHTIKYERKCEVLQ